MTFRGPFIAYTQPVLEIDSKTKAAIALVVFLGKLKQVPEYEDWATERVSVWIKRIFPDSKVFVR